MMAKQVGVFAVASNGSVLLVPLAANVYDLPRSSSNEAIAHDILQHALPQLSSEVVSATRDIALLPLCSLPSPPSAPPGAATHTEYYGAAGAVVDQLYGRMQEAQQDKHASPWHWANPSKLLQEFYSGTSNLLLHPDLLMLLRNWVHIKRATDDFDNRLGEFVDICKTKTDICIEYAPHFFVIPFQANTIPPFTHTNAVLIASSSGCLIVDPGAMEADFDRFKVTLQRLIPESAASNIQVFITHHHNDHLEALPLVAELYPKARVYAHQNTLERLSTPLTTEAVDQGYKFTIKDCKNEETDVPLDITLEVIAGHGHTDGHLFLFNETTRTLVAGDHIVGYGSVSLDALCGNMIEYLKTTQHMIDLEPRLAIPAHGHPTFQPVPLLKQYQTHRLQRETEILAAIDKGATDVDGILAIVYPTLTLPRLQRAARSNIMLHLQKLIAEERLPAQFARF